MSALKMMSVVARKELMDGLRDRRAIYTLIFSSLFGPALIAFMFTQLAGQERAAQEIQIPITGRANGPLLVHWLEQQPGVQVVDGPAKPEAAVRDRSQDFVLVIEKEFAEKFRESRPAPVKLVSDSTRQSSRPKVKRLESLLNHFSSQIGALRLMARGVSPLVASALKIEDVEISNAAQRAATIFNFIPLFLIAAAFSAGMQIATDATAGERERFSLEPLLINPVPRWQLVGGKWLAAAVAAIVGMAGTLVITAYALSRMSLEDLGVRFHLGVAECLLVFAAVVPMALVAPAVQLYLACFAKTFKEAQSYMAYVLLGAMLPGLLSTFYPITDKPWMRPLPLMGQYILATDILSGKIPSPLAFVASAVLGIVAAVLFLSLATRLFYSEKIIFGR
jgi:sodium transport system permease protein